jgi:hypothetical protein
VAVNANDSIISNATYTVGSITNVDPDEPGEGGDTGDTGDPITYKIYDTTTDKTTEHEAPAGYTWIDLFENGNQPDNITIYNNFVVHAADSSCYLYDNKTGLGVTDTQKVNAGDAIKSTTYTLV